MVTVADALTWVKENVAGSVSTVSLAVSTSRSCRPVSACPAMYRCAANGVAVVSAALTHFAAHDCQV